MLWFHDFIRPSYVICVACLFRLIALRTSYVTCVSCLFRLMVLRTSDVTCTVASLDLGLFRLVVLRTSYITCVACLYRLQCACFGSWHVNRLPEIPSESMCFQWIRWTPSNDFPTLLKVLFTLPVSSYD